MKIETYDDVFRVYVNKTILSLFYTREDHTMNLAYMLADEVGKKMLIYLYHTDTYARKKMIRAVYGATWMMNEASRESGFERRILPYSDEKSVWELILEDMDRLDLPYNEAVYSFLKNAI